MRYLLFLIILKTAFKRLLTRLKKTDRLGNTCKVWNVFDTIPYLFQSLLQTACWKVLFSLTTIVLTNEYFNADKTLFYIRKRGLFVLIRIFTTITIIVLSFIVLSLITMLCASIRIKLVISSQAAYFNFVFQLPDWNFPMLL